MTLDADEFIRRFLLHVLPGGFHRVRHYGLLSNGSRTVNLARSRELLGAVASASFTIGSIFAGSVLSRTRGPRSSFAFDR